MLQGEHSAILSTFIKLQFVFEIFAFSTFARPFYTGFNVSEYYYLIGWMAIQFWWMPIPIILSSLSQITLNFFVNDVAQLYHSLTFNILTGLKRETSVLFNKVGYVSALLSFVLINIYLTHA